MRKLLTLGLASMFLAVVGCQDTATTGPVAGPNFHEVGDDENGGDQEFDFAMLDDFAGETTGASGSGEAEVDDGAVEVEVEAEGLVPGHDYELNVTIDFASVVTIGTVTADEDGEIEFEGDIALDPGTYRLDFFVTHTHPTIPDPVFAGLLDRDLLLRCAPFVLATIVADD